MVDTLLNLWNTSFGERGPEIIVRAPGRVNIIGEHTDYNEGWVLPGAMSRSMYILMSRAKDKGHHWIASDLEEELMSMEQVIEYGQYSWSRYIQGAINLYTPGIGSLRIIIGGDLPVGAGISSSSALVCGILMGLRQITGKKESPMDIALLGSRVEREVIGLQGGIMDQFAILLSQKDHVMLLDCRSREYSFIPAELPGCRWLLVNTRVKHSLIDSDYNKRAAQCQEAVTVMQKQYPSIQSLRDVTIEMVSAVSMSDILKRRAIFVVEENIRVHAMTSSLRDHDPGHAGQLLQASHAGLRDQYEVSCEELDHLADFANTYPGVYGARMMGGGFGGCVICLVKENVMKTFTQDVIQSYSQKFGFAPEVIAFELGGGLQVIDPCAL